MKLDGTNKNEVRERKIEINKLQQSEILGVFGYEGSLWALWVFFFF